MYLKRTTRETYQCKHQTFINASIKQELKCLEQLLTNANIFKLETPISHLVLRDFDIVFRDDVCIEVCGSFSDDCKFWVQHKFSESIKNLALKRLKIKTKK